MPASSAALTRLAAAVRQEIAAFDYPRGDWTVDHGVDDVLVVGAGQAGVSLAIRLHLSGVARVRVIDAAPAGAEGPWTTWARMPTLRTPKELFGPENGIRAASFRSWYDAVAGEHAYDELALIPRAVWADYLAWVRDVFAVPVESGTVLETLTPDGDRWRAGLRHQGGVREIVARKVVACTGMGGTGGPTIPPFVAALPRDRWWHSSDALDLAALHGRRVVVLGLGASAFDNAAVALESGAAEVRHLGRRSELPTLNSYRFLEKKGLFASYAAMPDAVRLAFARTEQSVAIPPTDASIERCRAHDVYSLELGTPVEAAEIAADGSIVLTGPGVRIETDAVIAGTGFTVDLAATGWLAGIAPAIRLWRDVVALDDSPLDRAIGRHPYLTAGMACQPAPGAHLPALGNLHLFSLAAHVSHGIACVGLNGLPWSVDNVASAIVDDLIAQDSGILLDDFRTYTAPARADGSVRA